MSLFWIGSLVASLGAVGGLVNCFHTDEFHLPRIDKKARLWRPGWIGVVVTGAAAAVIVWGVYGPAAAIDLNGEANSKIPVQLSQVLSSLLVGFSGGKFLRMAVEKKADELTKVQLTEAIEKLVNPPTA